MTHNEAFKWVHKFWCDRGIPEPDNKVVMVMVDNVRALDDAGFADLDTIVSLLYTVYFAGYTTGRDGRRMETR